MKPLLVLCLGNDVLSDDAFGPVVASRMQKNALGEDVEVLYASLAGFGLLELLQGRDSVLIVDAIRTGSAQPGTLHFFSAGELVPSNSLINSHQINLPTALELGRQLGLEMPGDIQVLAVEALDTETLSEELTEAVAEAVAPSIQIIKSWISQKRRQAVGADRSGDVLAQSSMA